MFDIEKSGAEEIAKKARQAGERAVALAPALGEARAALAHMDWVFTNAVGCARQLREALRIAPSSIDLNELYGRVLLEFGEIDRGIARLERVVSIEPSLRLARDDIIRARAMLGDGSAFEAELEAQRQEGGGTGVFILSRLAMWRRDAALAPLLRKQMQRQAVVPRLEALTVEVLETLRMPAELVRRLEEARTTTDAPTRRRLFVYQFATEVLSFLDDERALETLGWADRTGLIDVAWADRCPLLAPWRDRPAFAEIRERVAGRAKAALDVLDSKSP
jgi:hypothetical protein